MKITKIIVKEGFTKKVKDNYFRSDLEMESELSPLEGENFSRVKTLTKSLRREVKALVKLSLTE